FGGWFLSAQKQQLRAEQPDAVGAAPTKPIEFLDRRYVCADIEPAAINCRDGPDCGTRHDRLTCAQAIQLAFVEVTRGWRQLHHDQSAKPVDDDVAARRQEAARLIDTEDRGNAQGASEDHD